MRRYLFATAAAIVVATAISRGQSGPSQVAAPGIRGLDEAPQAWFVELVSPPVAEGTSAVALAGEEARFHSAASAAGIRYAESRHFRNLWNGLTVKATGSEAGKLRDLSEVAAVYPVVNAERAQQEAEPGSVIDMVTALAMTGADVAQNELGLTGRGVRVAVIDSGIDYDHPDLGGCFGPGCRVAKGWDFVGDSFNPDPVSAAFNPTPAPDPFPDDCEGHGTHVAGIVAASGTIRGVAPKATLYAYRVFGCAGPTTTDVMLAAMEQAFDDRADVLNMSIGAALQWPKYPTSQAAARLVRKGMVVVSSAGNDANFGLYATSAPATGRGVIAVASFDNTFANLASFTVTPDDRRVAYLPATATGLVPTTGGGLLARTGTVTAAADACNPLTPASLTGRIALVRRGTCGFAVKAANAQAAGADGVIFYNNGPGRISLSVAGPVAITIPVVSITSEDGAALDAGIAAGNVSLTWTAAVVSEPQLTANLISTFSSYGPAADLSMKPDLGAPGGSIRSTLPLQLGGFGNLSGTSMASPYVAGAVALLLEAHPRLSPDDVLTALQNSARPHNRTVNPADGLDLVHRQGAGMITVDQTILAEASVTPSRLALGEFESATPIARRLHVATTAKPHRGWHRHGWKWHDDDNCTAVTYTLGHEPAPATTANTFVPTLLPTAFASVSFDEPTVTVGHGDERWIGHRHGRRGRGEHDDDDEVVAFIAPPADPQARLFGGYITLTPDDDGAILRVPYLGYSGDYQAIQALTPLGTANLPWLAKLNGASLVNQPGGASFTLTGADTPRFVYHLDHQVSRFRIEIVEAGTGQLVGVAEDDQFVGRNTLPATIFVSTWDGTVTPPGPGGAAPAPVPNGGYQAVISVLKALGDPANPAHVERWTSPTIVIARP